MTSESGCIFSSPFKILYTSIKSPLILLISNVVRFNLLSYGKLFNSGIILVNLRCTPSINLMCDLVDVVT